MNDSGEAACPVTWDTKTGEFARVEGPKGFATWEEAEEAGRFLRNLEATE